jgi:hypothetical protein
MRDLLLATLPVLGLIACNGADGVPGPKGDPGAPADGGSPTISAIVPPAGLLERDVDVVISGVQTSFDGAATVDFGPGITVSETTLVSTAELRCRVHIDGGAQVGSRDVKVTSAGATLVATQGFEVRPSLALALVSASPSAGAAVQQGDLFLVDLASLDDQPLASASSAVVTTDNGLFLLPSGGDPTAGIWQFLAVVDVASPVGNKRITWKNPGFTGRTFVSDGAVMAVGARTPVDIPAPFDPTAVVFDVRSKLYAISTSQLGILSFTGNGGGMALSPLYALSAPSAGIVTIGQLTSGLAFATRNTAATFDLIIGAVPTIGTDASHTLTLETLFTSVASTTLESGSAHPYATPQTLAAPAIVDGTLAVSGEDDSYVVNVPGGSSVEFSVLADQALQYGIGIGGNAPRVMQLDSGGMTFRISNPGATPLPLDLQLVATAPPTNYTVTARLY